jgi:osmotically-inducible protein OsmY
LLSPLILGPPFALLCTSRLYSELVGLFSAKEDFAKMRRRIEGFLLLGALLVLVAGCDNTANNNRAVNANANATATATPISTPVTSANDNRRAPTRAEYEANKERYNREAKQSGRTVGTGLNDGWLWVKTRFDLAAADDLRDSTINVDVDKGVVTLTGTVASAAQKTRAEAVAKSVEGVTGVRNQLKVQAANTNANAKATPTPKK